MPVRVVIQMRSNWLNARYSTTGVRNPIGMIELYKTKVRIN